MKVTSLLIGLTKRLSQSKVMLLSSASIFRKNLQNETKNVCRNGLSVATLGIREENPTLSYQTRKSHSLQCSKASLIHFITYKSGHRVHSVLKKRLCKLQCTGPKKKNKRAKMALDRSAEFLRGPQPFQNVTSGFRKEDFLGMCSCPYSAKRPIHQSHVY